MLCSLLLLASCGSQERQAERLYREASQAIEEERLDDAVELFDRIQREYPDSQIAHRAQREKESLLYRGLAGAVKSYPTRAARDSIILAARAIERYRGRKGSYPEQLARLVPDYLKAEPSDPWGRPFDYRRKPRGRGYVLSCFGSDGEPGGTEEATDIVVEDGRFVRGGEGLLR